MGPLYWPSFVEFCSVEPEKSFFEVHFAYRIYTTTYIIHTYIPPFRPILQPLNLRTYKRYIKSIYVYQKYYYR